RYCCDGPNFVLMLFRETTMGIRPQSLALLHFGLGHLLNPRPIAILHQALDVSFVARAFVADAAEQTQTRCEGEDECWASVHAAYGLMKPSRKISFKDFEGNEASWLFLGQRPRDSRCARPASPESDAFFVDKPRVASAARTYPGLLSVAPTGLQNAREDLF